MKRYTLAVALLASCCSAGFAQAQPATWQGGDGFWNDDNWSFDAQSDLFADEVLGVNTGMQVGNGELSTDALIDNGAVTFEPDLWGDFQFNSEAPGNGGTLTITGGASLSMNTAESDTDGLWTQFNADTLTLDNGTLRRTFSGPAEAGGVFSFGGIRGYDGMDINVNLTNGGRIENDGLLTFGWYGAEYPGRKVTMTINDGSLDLANSGGFDFLDGVVGGAGNGVLQFHYSWDDDAGAPIGEQYAVNFTGPGSITVDESAILVVVQTGPDGDADYDFDTITTPVSYQDLWDKGILQANGFSGIQGTSFGAFFSTTGAVGDPVYTLTSNVVPAVPIVWEGGDGFWNDDNWTAGAQTGLFADEALGRNNGMEIGSGELGYNVFINSGNVTYEAGAWGDFRFRRGGSLNIGPGATFTIDSSGDGADQDGIWTEFDGDAIVIDGGTLARTFAADSEGGGAMMLLSWRNYDGQKLAIDIKNGGRFENDGQVWFGAPGDSALGIEVIMTIDDGTMDLTGGDNFELNNDSVLFLTNDLTFTYGWDENLNDGAGGAKGETYAINFIGGGQVITDTGIIVAVEEAPGDYGTSADNLVTYEELWDMGILQADGLSGLDGETFGDYFSVTGTSGAVDYTLTSLVGQVGLAGDFDMDGDVDGNDALWVQLNDPTLANWALVQDNLGNTAAVASVGAVPEPASLVLVLLGGVALLASRRRG